MYDFEEVIFDQPFFIIKGGLEDEILWGGRL
jgi:hypothetical protein